MPHNSDESKVMELAKGEICDIARERGPWNCLLLSSTTMPLKDSGIPFELIRSGVLRLGSAKAKDESSVSDSAIGQQGLTLGRPRSMAVTLHDRPCKLILLPTMDSRTGTVLTLDQLGSALRSVEHLLIRRRASARVPTHRILTTLLGTGAAGLPVMFVAEGMLRLAIRLAPYGCRITIGETNPETAQQVLHLLSSDRVTEIFREASERSSEQRKAAETHTSAQSDVSRAELLMYRVRFLLDFAGLTTNVDKPGAPRPHELIQSLRSLPGLDPAVPQDLIRGIAARNSLMHHGSYEPTDIEFGLAASNRLMQLIAAQRGREGTERLRRYAAEERGMMLEKRHASRLARFRAAPTRVESPDDGPTAQQSPTSALMREAEARSDRKLRIRKPAQPTANADQSPKQSDQAPKRPSFLDRADDAEALEAPTVDTAHIEQFVRFFQNGLAAEELSSLLGRLREAEGYRGTDDLVLREYCWRGDPVHLLSDLGSSALQRLHRQYFGSPAPGHFLASGSTPELAVHILDKLGFPKQMALHGIHQACDELERLERKSLQENATETLTGTVIHAAGQMEHVLRTLIRFLCMHLFRTSPDQHFSGRRPQYTKHFFAKATLGTQLTMLEDLAEQIDAAAPGSLPELGTRVTGARIAPEGKITIANLRNAFGHFNAEKPPPLGVARQKARDFFSEARRLLQYWRDADPEIFPHIVRVEEIRIDRWNRLTATAVNDRGHQETIISEKRLHAGRTYFMYPLNNPCRVDPILIEVTQG